MKLLRFLRGFFRETASAAISFGLLWYSPAIIERLTGYSDTGVMTGPIVQVLLVSAGFFFALIFGSWVAYSISFRTFDKQLDAGAIEDWLKEAGPRTGLTICIGTFFALLWVFSTCLQTAARLLAP